MSVDGADQQHSFHRSLLGDEKPLLPERKEDTEVLHDFDPFSLLHVSFHKLDLGSIEDGSLERGSDPFPDGRWQPIY